MPGEVSRERVAEAGILDLTVDGADEVAPNLDLIKGWGRCLVREKIVAASSKRLVILVGEEKLVAQLGERGKLPVEVVPFGLPLCQRRLRLSIVLLKRLAHHRPLRRAGWSRICADAQIFEAA